MAQPTRLSKDLEEALTKNIVALSMTGKNATQIAEETKISVYQVRRLMSSPAYKELINEQADEAVTQARAFLKSRTERLAPQAWEALERLINSDKGRDVAEGLRAYFRLINLEKGDEGDGVGNLVINLPGQTGSQIIDVKREDTDVDS